MKKEILLFVIGLLLGIILTVMLIGRYSVSISSGSGSTSFVTRVDNFKGTISVAYISPLLEKDKVRWIKVR